jgi:hypothetical protein
MFVKMHVFSSFSREEIEKSNFSISNMSPDREWPRRDSYMARAITMNLEKNHTVILPDGVVIHDVREIDCYYEIPHFHRGNNNRSFIIYFVSSNDIDISNYHINIDIMSPYYPEFPPIILENENDRKWNCRKDIAVLHTALSVCLKASNSANKVLFNRRFIRHLAIFL